MLTDRQLEALKTLIERPLMVAKPGDYIEEEPIGTITIRRKDGTPVVVMSLETWEEIMDYGERLEAQDRAKGIKVRS